MKLKRLYAVLLSLSMAITIIPSVFAENAAENTTEQAQTTEAAPEATAAPAEKTEVFTIEDKATSKAKYEEYYELMTAMGIAIESVRASAEITRLDFAKMVTAMLNENPELNKYRTKELFEDLPKSNKEAGYPNFVAEKTFMRAKDGNKFMPKDKLTAEDAAYTAVRLLGYDVYNQLSVNSPNSDYYRVALSLKLYDGVKKDTAATCMDFEDCITLLYNVLNTQVVEATYEYGGYAYGISDELYMTTYFDVEYETGVMYSDGITSIKGNGGVTIGDRSYDIGNCKTDGMIGKRVTAYYVNDGWGDVLIYLSESDRNNILKLYGRDIDSYEDFVYTYSTDSGKSKKEDISKSIDIVYNGAVVTSANVAKVNYIPEHGYIELIDNNMDKDYDVLIINDYKEYVVDGVNQNTETIKSKLTSDKIEYGEYKNVRIYDTTGAAVEISAIPMDTSIAVLASLDKSVLVIRMHQKNITGAVAGLKLGGNSSVTVQGKIYLVPKSVEPMLAKVKAGNIVDLYLDMYGSVFHIVSKGDAGYTLAYLTKAYFDETGEELYIEYYDSTTVTFVTKKCAKSINVDGAKLTPTQTRTALKASGMHDKDGIMGNTFYQPLRVQLSSKDEVIKIDTADNTTNVLTEATGDLQKLYFAPEIHKNNNINQPVEKRGSVSISSKDIKELHNGYFDENGTWVSVAVTWLEVGVITGAVPVICVPANRQDEMSYTTKTLADIQGDGNIVDLYKITNDGLYPDFAVHYSGNGLPEEGSTAGINHWVSNNDAKMSAVESMMEVVNKNGDVVTQLKLITEGKSETLNVYDNLLATTTVKVKPGEIIRYSVNGNGDIWGIEHTLTVNDFKAAVGRPGINSIENALGPGRISLYNAYRKDGDALVLTMKDPTTLDSATMIIPRDALIMPVRGFKNVYYWDKDAEVFVKADETYIKDYENDKEPSKIAIRTRSGSLTDMYIYDRDAFN